MTTGQQARTFNEVRTRLEEIVEEVRDKDLSLEKSLDLYEEAIKLGNRCSDLIDKADYSPEEAEQLAQAHNAEQGVQPHDTDSAQEEVQVDNDGDATQEEAQVDNDGDVAQEEVQAEHDEPQVSDED